MADHEPQQAGPASGWQPEVEDGVNSVDGNPEDREAEVHGVPGNSQGTSEGGYGYQCHSVPCTKRRLWLEKENKKLANKVQYLQRKTRDLQDALNEALARGKEPRGKQTERTWPEKLGVEDYGEIYKLSCLEENSNPKTIHPALVFKTPSAARIDREARLFVENARQATENASVLQELVLNPSKPRHFLEYRMKYSFRDLPGPVQERIFQFLFWYPNKLIHAISRLDPFVEPEDLPPISGKRSGLLSRFHITGKKYGHGCSLTHAQKGNELLAPLLVSRQFLFLGTHVFYGRNTFAFSSLGKFGRFTQGIGPARTQRLQHIELLWIGAQLVTMEGHSRRTWALASLCEMPRLKSLTVYLNESHVRRKHEGIVQMAYLANKTSGKPSFRMNRDLRTVQGMDYVRQLRGLRVLKFLDNKTCDPVRDWSFVLDLETTCKRDKPYAQHLESKLENLLPLPERFNPSEWEWNAARSHYDMGWLPERLPDDYFQDAVARVTPPGSAMDVRSASPGALAAALARLQTAAVDFENGSDRVFAGSVNRVEDIDSIPPLEAATQGIAQSIRADRSETMDIDQVSHGIDAVEEGPFAEIQPTQELVAQPEPQGHQGPIPDQPGQPQVPGSEDGLFVADHSGRPPTEAGSEVNLEQYDFPLVDQLRLPTIPEAREKSPKQEENMYVGVQPGSPERKPGQDEVANGQGSAEDEDGDLGWEGEQPSSSGDRPSYAGKRPPSSGKHPSFSGKRPSYSEKRPSYSGKRLPSYGGKRLPSQAALKHPPNTGGPSTGEEDDASTSGSDGSSESGHSEHEPDGGDNEGELDGGDNGGKPDGGDNEGEPEGDDGENEPEDGDVEGNDFGDEVVETIGVDDVGGGDQGGTEDQNNTIEGALHNDTGSGDSEDQHEMIEGVADDGIASQGGSDSSSGWGGCSPEPEDKTENTATSSAQSEQNDDPEAGRTHEAPPGSNAKKRHGEELSPNREKRARSTPE